MNFAAVDIGTNSVRLLITDEQGAEVERYMRMTRLGQGVDVSGVLHPDAIARTVDALRDFGERLQHHGVGHVRAVATSASRDARNSSVFFDAAEQALGVRPELLTGAEEAQLSFQGATAGLDVTEGPFLVVDLGGGSTEFVLGSAAPEALISVDMGCVRMTERHLHGDPPSKSELEACVTDVRHKLAAVKRMIDPRRVRRMLGLAGTVAALAHLQKGLRQYDATQTHHSRLTREQVGVMFTRLSNADVQGRRGMLAEPKRAEVIVGGAAVLLTILNELDLPELTVSERDILDGIVASLRSSRLRSSASS